MSKDTCLTTGNLLLKCDRYYAGDPEKDYPPSYRFGICLRAAHNQIGHITVRVGNDDVLRNYSGHISFGIDEAYRGNRYAAEACRAIVLFARSLGIWPVRATCDPDNVASARTCELAGGKFIEEVDVPPGNYVYDNGGRRKRQYEFDSEGK